LNILLKSLPNIVRIEIHVLVGSILLLPEPVFEAGLGVFERFPIYVYESNVLTRWKNAPIFHGYHYSTADGTRNVSRAEQNPASVAEQK
jgi:hypothetical protein